MRLLLKPTGWVQMVEYYLNVQSNTGRLTSESALRRWWEYYVTAMEASMRNPRAARNLAQLLTEAGYRHVGSNAFQLPIGGWRSGKPWIFFSADADHSSDIATCDTMLTMYQSRPWPGSDVIAWR